MRINILELKDTDKIIIRHCIGNMPTKDANTYTKKLMPLLKSTFGKGRVSLFPCREGNTWDFMVIREPKRKTTL